MASGQGLLLPAIRRTPPGSEARQQGLALHYILVASYYLALVWQPATWPYAVGARLLFFDLVINATSGKPLFFVGSTAGADKLMQWLASKLKQPAERVRCVGWLLCVVGAGCWLLLR